MPIMTRIVGRKQEGNLFWLAATLALVTLGIRSEAATLADNFADAIPLSGFTNAVGSNVGATAEPLEPAHAGEPAAHSVWALWTATTTGAYCISTSNSLTASRLWMDTVLAVYTG